MPKEPPTFSWARASRTGGAHAIERGIFVPGAQKSVMKEKTVEQLAPSKPWRC
jgi:hypothetical protein